MESIDFICFLDEKGRISEQLSSKEKLFASFLSEIVSSASKVYPIPKSKTDLNCIKNGCYGKIYTLLSNYGSEIDWHCPVCQLKGRIYNWKGTQWDFI